MLAEPQIRGCKTSPTYASSPCLDRRRKRHAEAERAGRRRPGRSPCAPGVCRPGGHVRGTRPPTTLNNHHADRRWSDTEAGPQPVTVHHTRDPGTQSRRSPAARRQREPPQHLTERETATPVPHRQPVHLLGQDPPPGTRCFHRTIAAPATSALPPGPPPRRRRSHGHNGCEPAPRPPRTPGTATGSPRSPHRTGPPPGPGTHPPPAPDRSGNINCHNASATPSTATPGSSTGNHSTPTQSTTDHR
ncbi:hypothetical protein NRB56_04190 [Nocardia sp. RB56]|uniref:Uncharacterized protein n=1 Tax=Nocardia aurantia TaxID=2585199 RepID=A0A7K0DGC8_9NOCA|nr:hypothetical protein [Nocardia aurantia]